MEILENLFRTLMFGIDKVAYGLIPTIYKLFVYLSELNLYGDDPSNPLHQLVNHIYVLLGIFMLFKVSFSLLQYIVDPNAFRDSSKGFGKLVTNVLVAMVLLVIVPHIFSFASKLQSVIVQENVIGQLILGTSVGSSTSGVKVTADKAEEMATDLQFMLYGAFYNINTNIVTECEGSSGVLGSVDMALTDGCLDGLSGRLSGYSDASSNGVNLRSFFKYTSDDEECNGVCDDRNFEHFDKLLWWKEDGEYVINYLPMISAAAGIYVVFLLISFSIDVAVRAIKLCFLQMVAPIAIVSYIDPKEQISNGKLYNWIKETASTYFSLFLRLATIFLVMLLIEMIANSILTSGGGENYIDAQIPESGYNIWIYLFLVIGAFMFAKQVPKIIESIFGIKGSGELNLNPFKNQGMAGLAGVGAFAGGAVLGGVGNTIANISRNKDLKEKLAEGKIDQATYNSQYKNSFQLVKSAVGGVGSGAARSAIAGTKAKNPFVGISQGVKASSDKRRARDAGYGFVQNTKDRFGEMIGLERDMGTTDATKAKIKALRNKMSNAQRDEASASYQMQDLMTRDPNITKSMRQAFTENDDGNLKYESYYQFLRDNISQYGGDEAKQLFDEVESRMTAKIQNGEKDLSNEFNEINALVDNVNADGKTLLTRQDYDNYNDARTARNKADEDAKKYEKEISQLEETKGFQAHLNGGKK